ncbi:uncharacterized protein [Spinacia oleracea]|uniref:RRM domain-containing protein n=1 Tax=Spinacia oleracea TaxID=3562 RepID=A0ABM3RP53_SPIOL|nr:uncharacterized protein LOC110784591 [Spinacia oleracea]
MKADSEREDHHDVLVGNLSLEVTDATLFACFSPYQTCSDARVMWDRKTGHSRGFGFVLLEANRKPTKKIRPYIRVVSCHKVGRGTITNVLYAIRPVVFNLVMYFFLCLAMISIYVTYIK